MLGSSTQLLGKVQLAVPDDPPDELLLEEPEEDPPEEDAPEELDDPPDELLLDEDEELEITPEHPNLTASIPSQPSI